MINFKDKSQKELQEMLQSFSPDSTEYKVVSFEIQRIQQDTNNIQTANLIELTRKNAETSEKTAKSNEQLAKTAIVIAITIGILQILVQICF